MVSERRHPAGKLTRRQMPAGCRRSNTGAPGDVPNGAHGKPLVPHFALFFALSAARSGQLRGARAQE